MYTVFGDRNKIKEKDIGVVIADKLEFSDHLLKNSTKPTGQWV